MPDKFEFDISQADMKRDLNIEEIKQLASLWKMLDVKGVPIEDVPKEYMKIDAINDLMKSLCDIGKRHNLGQAELIITTRCALFDIIWQFILHNSEMEKQVWQFENK